MNFAPRNDAFFIPFSQLTNPVFSTDQVLTESSVKGISRYVGDSENASINYFNSDDIFLRSNWPLLLCGSTGTGKTSLALSVVARLIESRSVSFETARLGKSVRKPLILSAAEFARKLNSAIETDSVKIFRNRLSESSVLLIDNIHHIGRFKSHVQYELTLALEELTGMDVPVIATSHLTPLLIPGIAPQLASRLNHGLVIPLHHPGPVARTEIVRELLSIHGLTADEVVLRWLVNHLDFSVPKINQFLNQIRLSVINQRRSHVLDVKFLESTVNQLSVVSAFEKQKGHRKSCCSGLSYKPE